MILVQESILISFPLSGINVKILNLDFEKLFLISLWKHSLTLKVIIIAEKKYITQVSRLCIFFQCFILSYSHETINKAFYCLSNSKHIAIYSVITRPCSLKNFAKIFNYSETIKRKYSNFMCLKIIKAGFTGYQIEKWIECAQ